MALPAPPPSRPTSAFAAFQRGSQKLAHVASSRAPLATSQAVIPARWRVPNAAVATSTIARVFSGYAARVHLGAFRVQKLGRAVAPDADVYSVEALREHWCAAMATFAASEYPEACALLAGDPITELGRVTGATDAAAFSVAACWIDIVNNDRVATLQRNITRLCGVSNTEARLLVREIAELAVAVAFDTVDYSRLQYATSRSDEDSLLASLRASTLTVEWTADLTWSWKHLLPLLNKPKVRSDV